MAIESIEGIKALQLPNIIQNDAINIDQQNQEVFKSVLTESIKELNNEQVEAGELMQAFLKGEGPALHTVMISAEQANLSMEFAVQMRNKVLEAYQEVMRMQV